MDLPQQDFALIRDLLYERTGLRFDDKKRSFLASRVARRAAAVGLATAQEYYRRLRHLDADGREFQALVDQVTTNETYFFRDFPQLEGFANDILPQVADAKRAARDYSLNLWSACCSTGDEPYTLAMILAACLDDFPSWKVRVYATDIDTAALDTARAAVYGPRNVKDVPTPYLRRFFVPTARGEYRVTDAIRRMVTFEHLNLMDKAAMGRLRGFDTLFCRNALIYFDDDSRKQVLGQFLAALRPGGFLYLGHSESVSRITSAFEGVTVGTTVAYRKPLTARPAGVKR